MSVINASAPVVATDRSYETTDSRRANDPPAPGEPVAVDRYIADLLRRAHQTAEAVHGPDEARAILHVAQLFAEELAKTEPQFDRGEFIEAITREPA
jgi:hypothetical protein